MQKGILLLVNPVPIPLDVSVCTSRIQTAAETISRAARKVLTAVQLRYVAVAGADDLEDCFHYSPTLTAREYRYFKLVCVSTFDLSFTVSDWCDLQSEVAVKEKLEAVMASAPAWTPIILLELESDPSFAERVLATEKKAREDLCYAVAQSKQVTEYTYQHLSPTDNILSYSGCTSTQKSIPRKTKKRLV